FMTAARFAGALVALGVIGLVMARVHNRARAASVAGFLCATVAVLLGFATRTGFLSAALILGLLAIASGFLAAVVQALVWPLLMDTYPPAVRVRVFSTYGLALTLGFGLASAVAAADQSLLGVTWRACYLIFGALTVLASVGALMVRDPGRGR